VCSSDLIEYIKIKFKDESGRDVEWLFSKPTYNSINALVHVMSTHYNNFRVKSRFLTIPRKYLGTLKTLDIVNRNDSLKYIQSLSLIKSDSSMLYQNSKETLEDNILNFIWIPTNESGKSILIPNEIELNIRDNKGIWKILLYPMID
jgi:hypothetical protein